MRRGASEVAQSTTKHAAAGVWGCSPWWGPEAESLVGVRGQSPWKIFAILNLLKTKLSNSSSIEKKFADGMIGGQGCSPSRGLGGVLKSETQFKCYIEDRFNMKS